MLPPKPLEEVLPCLFRLLAAQEFLGCGHIPFASASTFMWLTSLCIFLFPLLSCKDPSHTASKACPIQCDLNSRVQAPFFQCSHSHRLCAHSPSQGHPSPELSSGMRLPAWTLPWQPPPGGGADTGHAARSGPQGPGGLFTHSALGPGENQSWRPHPRAWGTEADPLHPCRPPPGGHWGGQAADLSEVFFPPQRLTSIE